MVTLQCQPAVIFWASLHPQSVDRVGNTLFTSCALLYNWTYTFRDASLVHLP